MDIEGREANQVSEEHLIRGHKGLTREMDPAIEIHFTIDMVDTDNYNSSIIIKVDSKVASNIIMKDN